MQFAQNFGSAPGTGGGIPAGVLESRLLAAQGIGLISRAVAMHDAAEGALSIPEICVRLRVSRRALEYAFRGQTGESPARYFKLRRLHRARELLAGADPAGATVTEIATALGFHELGRFAVEYREWFGESPSATLGRLPHSRSAVSPGPKPAQAGDRVRKPLTGDPDSGFIGAAFLTSLR